MNIEFEPMQFSDRERFNWGFHDGTHDASRGRRPEWDGKPHYDRMYEAGYWRGVLDWKNTGVRSETSEPAWQAFTRTTQQQLADQFARTCASL